MRKKIFDFSIGNPPYQDQTIGDNATYAPPVYNIFLDEAYKVADKVEMIHPARFLFNAGGTPKTWNKKMLSDPHFKVLHYESNCSKIFSNVNITGGIAITYYDSNSDYGSIGIFTPYDELNSIFKKVVKRVDYRSLNTIMSSYSTYNLSDALFEEHPEVMNVLSNSKSVTTNIFDLLPGFFYETVPDDDKEYCCVLGRQNNKHCYSLMLTTKKYTEYSWHNIDN